MGSFLSFSAIISKAPDTILRAMDFFPCFMTWLTSFKTTALFRSLCSILLSFLFQCLQYPKLLAQCDILLQGGPSPFLLELKPQSALEGYVPLRGYMRLLPCR